MNSNWRSVEEQVMKYASHEERKVVKSMLSQYEEEIPGSTCIVMYWLLLLG